MFAHMCVLFSDAMLDDSWRRNALGAANSLVGQLVSLRSQLHAVSYLSSIHLNVHMIHVHYFSI